MSYLSPLYATYLLTDKIDHVVWTIDIVSCRSIAEVYCFLRR
jgi:hypothetical protein